MIKRLKLGIIVSASLFALGAQSIAHAAPTYCELHPAFIGGCIGYFTNGDATALSAHTGNVYNVVSGGLHVASAGSITSGTGMIGKLHEYLYNGSPQDQIGAAFVIDVMLGRQAQGAGRAAGIQYAKDNFGEFASLVRNYASQPAGSSYGVDWDATGSTDINSAYFSAISDDAYHTNRDGQPPVIRFFWNNGANSLEIEKSCGNLMGGVPPPKQSNWTLSSETSVRVNGGGWSTNNQIVYPGDHVEFNFEVDKSGNGTASNVTIVENWKPVPSSGRSGNINTDVVNMGPDYNDPYNFGIVQKVARGTQYCAQVTYNPKSYWSTASETSNVVCITVSYRDDSSPSVSLNPMSCTDTVLNGSALDPDNAALGVPVDIYKDGALLTTVSSAPPGFSYDIGNNVDRDGQPHSYYAVAHNIAQDGVQETPPNNSTSNTITIPPCYDYTYSPTSTKLANPSDENPSSIDFFVNTGLSTGSPAKCVRGATLTYQIIHDPLTGSSSMVQNGIDTNGGCLGDQQFKYTVGVPSSFQAGDTFCITGWIRPGSGVIDKDGVQVSVTVPQADFNKSCATITNKPFFKTFGSGVKAGGDFSTVNPGCSGGGQIKGWFNSSDMGNGYGASADLTALALLQINGFASNHLSSDGNTRPFTGRTFANTVGVGPGNVTNSNMGGQYAPGGSFCFPNPNVSNPESSPPANNIALNSFVADKSYVYEGNLRITGNGVVRDNRNIAIYVHGDLSIDVNINFSNADNWDAQGKINSFTAIVDGNIYIAPDVTQLDGVFIARHDSTRAETTGRIVTCYDTNKRQGFLVAEVFKACNQQLVIHGAFVADKVDLLRTFGTLRNEQSGVAPCSNDGTKGKRTDGEVSSRLTCAGEVFDFSPEIYLGKPPVQYNQSGKYKYDSIASLPPVL